MSTASDRAIRYYAKHPVEFARDCINAQPDKNQAKILQSVADNQMTSVRSGHGIGKSAVEAWTVIWFMCTRPFPKVPCTAPTQHQLYDILWSEIYKWIRSGNLENDLIWTKEKLYMAGHPEEWFAVARTASNPDALQGFHADNVLYIIDEASGVKDSIFEPILGALSTEGSRLLMCGNPTQLSGFFYESHTKNRSQYSTFHIDGRDSPRVSKAFIEKIIRMYGEDSNVFRVRVAGEFPKQEDDVFIPLPWIEQSINTELSAETRRAMDRIEKGTPIKPGDVYSIDIGADIARFGDDSTVIGYKVNEAARFYKRYKGQDITWTSGNIAKLYISLKDLYGFKGKVYVKVDDGGVGGGVVDELRAIKRADSVMYETMIIVPVHFGATIRHKFYYDTTTYMMGMLREMIQPFDDMGNDRKPMLVLPNDDDLVGELSVRKYAYQGAKVKVESKDQMKSRGLHSPDTADCMLLTVFPMKRAQGEINVSRKETNEQGRGAAH